VVGGSGDVIPCKNQQLEIEYYLFNIPKINDYVYHKDQFIVRFVM